MVEKAIVLDKVSKKYSDAFALSSVSISISKGNIAGIVGPNGAGKSTLLKIMSGFLSPDKGKVFVFGEKMNFRQLTESVSYMPEDIVFYENFYVSEIIEFWEKVEGYSFGNLVSKLGLNNILRKKIKNLSKGYKQRLKLFFSLANKKKLVLLDEPFDGFDPIQLKAVIRVLKEENKNGKTFVLSIHHLNYAEKICDYFVLLREGNVVEEGSFDFLKQKYGNALTLEEIFEKALI